MARKKIICMLMNDDFDDQELFGHALKHLDVSVDYVTENDGIHFIGKVPTEPKTNPHFIFVDVDMPKLSGVDCVVEIKKISKVKGRPVYMYSTYFNPESARTNSGRAVKLYKAHNMKELETMLDGVIPEQK